MVPSCLQDLLIAILTHAKLLFVSLGLELVLQVDWGLRPHDNIWHFQIATNVVFEPTLAILSLLIHCHSFFRCKYTIGHHPISTLLQDQGNLLLKAIFRFKIRDRGYYMVLLLRIILANGLINWIFKIGVDSSFSATTHEVSLIHIPSACFRIPFLAPEL